MCLNQLTHVLKLQWWSREKKSIVAVLNAEIIFSPTALLAAFGNGNQISTFPSNDISTDTLCSLFRSCHTLLSTEITGIDVSLHITLEQSIHLDPLWYWAVHSTVDDWPSADIEKSHLISRNRKPSFLAGNSQSRATYSITVCELRAYDSCWISAQNYLIHRIQRTLS